MSAPADRLLWEHVLPDGVAVQCRMLTCCAGAELQLVRDGAVTLRELYPDKSDLYERARALKADLAG